MLKKESFLKEQTLSLIKSLEAHISEETTADLGQECAEVNSPDETDDNASRYKGLSNSMVFLVVQMVKNLPAKQETLVPSLSLDDPLEKRMAVLADNLHIYTASPCSFHNLQAEFSPGSRHPFLHGRPAISLNFPMCKT